MIPGSGRSPGGRNGNPLQYSCLEKPIRGAQQATVHGVAKNRTQLRDHLQMTTEKEDKIKGEKKEKMISLVLSARFLMSYNKRKRKVKELVTQSLT